MRKKRSMNIEESFRIIRKVLFVFLIMATVLISGIGTNPALADGPTGIYVNSVSGDDGNDGASGESAVKTLAKAFTLMTDTGNYQIILAEGSYPSPGLVNVPAGATVLVTTASESDEVTVYKNPGMLGTTELFKFTSSLFSYITFDNITLTGDDPLTEAIEKSGMGVYLYSCDKVGGNTIEFTDCVFEDLESGINQEYSDYLSVIVRDSHITAKYPISMDYGKSLTVDASVLEMSEGEYWNSIINLDGSPIAVQITNNTLIGNNGAGRGIYEDVYSGTISGNTFKDLDIAIEANMHSVIISNNLIETSKNGLDLEAEGTNCSISVTNNTIVNKGLKGSGSEGIRIYNDDDDITAASFIIQDNKIVNFDTGLYYYDDHSSGITFTLGGTDHGNSFWGNVINIDWNPDWASAEALVDAKGNDWGTIDSAEVSNRIYADGAIPSSVFIFDEALSTDMISIAYVDDGYSSGSAGGHLYGVDAFSSIADAVPFVISGGKILVEDGNYIAPVWIDRPVSIKGQGSNVNLSKHPALISDPSVMTTVTAPDVTLENLRFSTGNYGIRFEGFTKHEFKSYPAAYRIIDCSFTDFDHIAIYEPYPPEEKVTGICAVKGNTIHRNPGDANGGAVYLDCGTDNLSFTGNTVTGNYAYGVALAGDGIIADNNVIGVSSTYESSALSVSSTGDLLCTGNNLTNNAEYLSGSAAKGLSLHFYGGEGNPSKEIYKNEIHGFNFGIYLYGVDIPSPEGITIGGSSENTNDFSDNEYGLLSSLFYTGSGSTNAKYNIWGKIDEQLVNYIKCSDTQVYYGPVTYLPSATSLLSDNASLSSLAASGMSLTPAFSSTTFNYTANVANNITDTTIAAVPTDSNATVKINGNFAATKHLGLSVGSNTITVQVTAEDGTTTKTYTIDINRAAGSGGGGGGSIPTDTGTKVTVTTTDGKVTVTGTLTQTNSGTQVVIKNSDFNQVNTADKPASIDAQLATVTFDKKAMDTIGTAAGSGDVTLTVRKVGTSELSAAQLALVGSRPVYDFTVTGGGKTISNFNGGHATVSIPYTLKAGENPHAIVIWYLSDSGKLVGIRGHYDTTTKSVAFRTPHFSSFAVGYNLISFKDIPVGAWYESAVTFLAARDITTGTGGGNFSPDTILTRGQFMVMLLRAYGIDPDASSVDNFADAGNTYYTNYLAVAKQLGIANGIGNNQFAPDKEITRQEMFTLLYNALTVIGELPEGNAGKKLSDFSDASQIAFWAKNAMTLLVETGTVSGSNGKLAPTDSTTRSEMAQVLYNLLTK